MLGLITSTTATPLHDSPPLSIRPLRNYTLGQSVEKLVTTTFCGKLTPMTGSPVKCTSAKPTLGQSVENLVTTTFCGKLTPMTGSPVKCIDRYQ